MFKKNSIHTIHIYCSIKKNTVRKNRQYMYSYLCHIIEFSKRLRLMAESNLRYIVGQFTQF